MSGATVKDAWDHGVVPYTSTGVFGKSSNVGTLMLAERVGEDRYAEMLTCSVWATHRGRASRARFAGLVPSRDQWSGGTFANLPIGQGLSMTLLQMTGMYQAIANDGVRIPPRIVKSTIELVRDADRSAPSRRYRGREPADSGDRSGHVPIGHAGRHRQSARDGCWRGRRGLPGQRVRPAPRSRSIRTASATPTPTTGSRSPASPRQTTRGS